MGYHTHRSKGPSLGMSNHVQPYARKIHATDGGVRGVPTCPNTTGSSHPTPPKAVERVQGPVTPRPRPTSTLRTEGSIRRPTLDVARTLEDHVLPGPGGASVEDAFGPEGVKIKSQTLPVCTSMGLQVPP